MGVVCMGVQEVKATGFGVDSSAGLKWVAIVVLGQVVVVEAQGREE